MRTIQHWIGGTETAGASTRTVPVWNPATGEQQAEVLLGEAVDSWRDAYPVGDRFLLLKRGKSLGGYAKSEISLPELTALMAGGAELESLAHELEREPVGSHTAEVAKEMLAESCQTT